MIFPTLVCNSVNFKKPKRCSLTMGAEHSTASHSNRQRGMPAYSRHTGKNMGSHTHYKGDRIGHPSSNLIGRTRVTKVSESYSVYFYMRWNLDTMKGQRTSKICSLRRGFVVMRFFSINYTITGPGKLLHRRLRYIEVRLIQVPPCILINKLCTMKHAMMAELHVIVLGSSYVFPPCSKQIAL